MEIFRTENSYVLLCGESSLWIDKNLGDITVKPAWELANGHDPVCMGIFFGLIGCIRFPSVIEDHVLLVKESVLVGELPSGHAVHKIKSIALLQPTSEVVPDLGLKPCPKHHRSVDFTSEQNISTNSAISKTWTSLKTATTNIKSSSPQVSQTQNTNKQPVQTRRETREKERYQRRIKDELLRIFTDTDSFYFCPAGGDITNSVYRQYQYQNSQNRNQEDTGDRSVGFSHIDDRFFWNKHMLQDIISLYTPLSDVWVMPIIQGYVEIKDCKIDFGENQKHEVFTISLISRRSRHRVGTRYRRRGLDDQGHCANYVETEQVIKYKTHVVSFVLVRGSIPLYWSQQGYKYRPPPQLDRTYEENQAAFGKHMTEELARYGPTVIVNLVERAGKEAVVGDAYAEYICAFNSEDVTYVTFDFHHYCRGMHIENATLLIDELQDEIARMAYCWIDKHGLISKQNGVFRVNCIDCLDRTNVVQTALAREVLMTQLIKLGLVSPETPGQLFSITQQMWANNGDVISKQYAGTNALKGDITRTGGRKISGMMKDGMNSANRYVRNYYADFYTQNCLNLIHGCALESPPAIVSLIDDTNCTLDQSGRYLLSSATDTSCDFVFSNEVRLLQLTYLLSRYYLSRFKDATRQTALDVILGNKIEDSTKDSSSEEDDENEDDEQSANEEEKQATIEHIKLVIEDVKKFIIEDPSDVLSAWGLVNNDIHNADTSGTDMDVILVLTDKSYFVVEYDTELDKVVKFEEIPLECIKLIEILVWNSDTGNSSSQNTKASRRQDSPILTIHYLPNAGRQDQILQHSFKSTNIRLFNNVAVFIKNTEEKVESLRAIAETIQVTHKVGGFGELEFNMKFLQRKSSMLNPEIYNFRPSDVQLSSLKNVGSKALLNVSQQFSKFNKFGQSFKMKSKEKIEKPDVSRKMMRSESTESQEAFLPTAGIVISNVDIESAMSTADSLAATVTEHNNKSHLTGIPPEIVIESNSPVRTTGVSLPFSSSSPSSKQELSRSSEDLDVLGSTAAHRGSSTAAPMSRCISDKDLSLNLAQGHGGEMSSLRSIKSGFATATSALVSPSSPLSKLAKGVQSLGMNLDPRKPKQEPQFTDNTKLKEKWTNSNCKSKLVAL